MVPVAFLFFLALGPVGWLAAGGVVILVGLVMTAMGDGDDSGPDRVNCGECGAPNDSESDECQYCEASL